MSVINLHPAQSAVYKKLFIDKGARYVTTVAARGFGKSYLASASAVTAAYELMKLDASVPNKDIYLIAPTHGQVKEIFYPLLTYEFGLESIAKSHSKDRGFFNLPSNVTIRLVSYESIERLRGKGSYFTGGDELTSWKKGGGLKDAWESVLLPMITSRWSRKLAARYGAPSPGRALNISTPRGFDYFHDMFMKEHASDEWASFQYDYTRSPYLDPDEVEQIRGDIDPISFAREYMASFEESGSSVFYTFDRKLHVDKTIEDFGEDEDVLAFIDFNIGRQSTSLWANRGNQLIGINELSNSMDTEHLADKLNGLYKNGKRKLIAFPDPTGNSRKTSASVGRTDFSILRSEGIHVMARSGSPSIVDSVKAVNRLLLTAKGKTNMYLHPRMKETIKSLERTTWIEGDGAKIDKSMDVEHFSDGVRYGSEYLFPVTAGVKMTKRGFGF